MIKRMKKRGKAFVRGYILKLFFCRVCSLLMLIMSALLTSAGIYALFFIPFSELYLKWIFFAVAQLSGMMFFFMHSDISFRNQRLLYVCSDETAVRLPKVKNRDTLRYMNLKMRISVLKTLYALFFFTPFMLSLIAVYMCVHTSYLKTVFFSLLASSVVLFVTGLILFLITAHRYDLAVFLMIRDNDMPISDAIRISSEKMNTNCLKSFLLSLSLCAYRLSCLVIVPCVYAIPYCDTVRRCFYHEIISGGKKEKAVVFDIRRPLKIIQLPSSSNESLYPKTSS